MRSTKSLDEEPAWRRSHEKRILMGVCQGLSDAFPIPVILIRFIFVLATVFGGWGILLYILLAVAPSHRPVSKKVEVNRKRGLLGRISYYFLVVFSTVLYIPVTLLVLSTSCLLLWGMFYPIFHLDIFYVSLVDLGPPGTVLGISLLTFFAYFFFLTLSVMGKIHQQKSLVILNPKAAVHYIFLVFVIVVSISSFVMMKWQRRYQVKKSFNHHISVVKPRFDFGFPNLKTSWLQIPLRRVIIHTEPRNDVLVRYTLTARGIGQTSLRQKMGNVALEWEEGVFFPQLQNLSSDFILPELEAEWIFPENLELAFETTEFVPLVIRGKWKKLSYHMQKGEATLEDVVTDQVELRLEYGYTHLEHSKIKRLNIYSKSASHQLRFCEITQGLWKNRLGEIACQGSQGNFWQVYNQEGKIKLIDGASKLELHNQNGQINMVDWEYLPESSIHLGFGEFYGYFSEEPNLKVSARGDQIKNYLLRANLNAGSSVLHAQSGQVLFQQR